MNTHLPHRCFAAVALGFLALLLTACGGGGGGTSSSTSTTTPTTTTTTSVTTYSATCTDGSIKTSTVSQAAAAALCPTTYTVTCTDGSYKTSSASYTAARALCPLHSTSVSSVIATPTYAAGSDQLAVYNLLNQERVNCGFGSLSQSTQLDQAAQAHAQWVVLNNTAGHDEYAGTPGFTGGDPGARAVAAGYSYLTVQQPGYGAVGYNTEIINFSQTNALLGLRALLSAPYHAIGAMWSMVNVGIGVQPWGNTVITNIDLTVPASAAGPQGLSDGTVLSYPCQGTTGVDYRLAGETPSPVDSTRYLNSNPTGPALVLLANDQSTVVLSTASLTLTGSTQTLALLPVKKGMLGWSAVFVLPDQPLAQNTSYTWTYSGVTYSNVRLYGANDTYAVEGAACSTYGGHLLTAITTAGVGLQCTDSLWTRVPGVAFSKTFSFTTGTGSAY